MERKQIFATQAGESLAQQICKNLTVQLGKVIRKTFSDGEIFLQLDEEVRGNDVFVIAPTNSPSENWVEALLLTDAIRQASAERVTAVIPYLGYNRQDRKDRPRVPRSALVMIETLKMSVDRVLLLDLHSEVTAGFFNPVIVDHIYGSAVIVPELKRLLGKSDYIIASPDKGGGPRAEKYATLLGQDDYVVFTKSRPAPNVVGKVKIIGNVKGQKVVLVDDMIDTGGTVIADAYKAKEAGAKAVWAVATHGLLSGDAIKNIDESPIKQLIFTDSVWGVTEKARLFKKTKVTVLSSAELFADAITRINEGRSVSSLIL